MKKILCIMIACIVLLYIVSIGAITELLIDAKEEEFYNSSYFMPAEHENDIVKQYTDGEITFEDLSNAIVDCDMRGLDMPYTYYMMFMDSGGNFISESRCILWLQIAKGIPTELSYKYIDLDKYLTEVFKVKYAETPNHVESVELYRENGEFTPVALNVVWFGEESDTTERIVLANGQANVVCANNYGTLTWEQGDEEIIAEIKDTPLYVEKDEAYNYFAAMAEGYAQELRKGTTITAGVLGGAGRLEIDRFTEYDYTVLNVSIGPYTYYTFSAVGVNLLEAVFEDSDNVKLLIAVTAIFAVIGTAMCGAAAYVYKRDN